MEVGLYSRFECLQGNGIDDDLSKGNGQRPAAIAKGG